MANKEENYTFPWGFHIGDLSLEGDRMPLYTPSNDGGFCLLYDKPSEKKVDIMMECLALEMLSTMPHESLIVDLFDFGKKKFYNLSPLQYLQTYKVSFDVKKIESRFEEIEDIIVARHQDLLCCNRQTIDEHNQKSKMKQNYHLILLSLANFEKADIELRRVKNFVESAQKAGVYVIAFGYHDILESENESTQAILNYFKQIKVTENKFAITPKIFEFVELLDTHTFESLELDKDELLTNAMTNANLESFMDPENIKLETDTRVK